MMRVLILLYCICVVACDLSQIETPLLSDGYNTDDTLSNDGYNSEDTLSNDGYVLDGDESFLLIVDYASRPVSIQCPSDEIISTQYKCRQSGEWVDCYKRSCCEGYKFYAGRCVRVGVDPCSLGTLCEQKCSVFFDRVICTCFAGYVFNRENHKMGRTPVCEDVNECSSNNGGCEHMCINTAGGYQCKCTTGYTLRADNKTCVSKHTRDVEGAGCITNCGTINNMQSKLIQLEEKLLAVTTAIKMYSFAADQDTLTREKGTASHFNSPRDSLVPSNLLSRDEREFDSYRVIRENGKRNFCYCKRGPQGPPGTVGATGLTGRKGSRGSPGPPGDSGESYDFLLLIAADMKHDIENLQDRVFGNNKPAAYNLKAGFSPEEITKYKKKQ